MSNCTIKAWYLRRLETTLETSLASVWKYDGLTCAPLTTKFPRIRIWFTPEGWVQNVRLFLLGEPEVEEGETRGGELCFDAIQKRTLAACASFDECCRRPWTLSHEQKVALYHLAQLEPFRVAHRESRFTIHDRYNSNHYEYYLTFMLNLLHYLTQNQLVQHIGNFFVGYMMNELINPMNWMRGLPQTRSEFDMFGEIIRVNNFCSCYVDSQCRTFSSLLKKLEEFISFNVLDGEIPCSDCSLLHKIECSQLVSLKEKIVK